MAQPLDLAGPLRVAILAYAPITALLPDLYHGEPPVFTAETVPSDAPSRAILIRPDTGITDADVIRNQRPISTRDIGVYADRNQLEDYRAVESIAYLLRTLFHRPIPFPITVPGYGVMQMTVFGPFPGPTDDVNEVARICTVTTNLRAL